MADSTVRIGADISEIRRELAKLPNLSTEAAQKTLIQIERAVVKAEKSAKASSKRIAAAQKQAARAARSASQGAGAAFKGTSQGLQSIALQLPDVASGLAMGTNAMTIFVQQGLQVVQVNMATTITVLKSVSALLMGPFGAALGAAGVAALVMANKFDEARDGLVDYRKVVRDTNADTITLTSSQNALRLATGDVAGFVGNLQIQTALMRGEIESADLQAGALGGTLADKLHPSLRAAGFAVVENEKRIRELQDATASGTLSFKDLITANQELDQAMSAQAGLEANLANIKLLRDEGADAINDFAAAVRAKDEAEAKNTKTVRGLTQAQKDQIAELEKVVDLWELIAAGFADLEQKQAHMADLDALSPDDLIASSTIERVRELTAAADKLVPPAGLARVDALRLMLIKLEAEAEAAGGTNELLADTIDRIGAAIEDADDDGPAFFQRLGEAATAAAATVRSAMAGIQSAIGGAIGLFDQFLQLLGGFSLADLATVAAEGSVTRDVLDAEGNVTGTETVGPGQVVEEMTAAGLAAVATFVASMPQVVDALIDALPKLFRAAQKAIPQLFKLAEESIPGFIDAVVTRAPKLVTSIIDRIPALFSAVLDELPRLILELGEGIGDIIVSVLDAVPIIVADLISELPKIVTAINLALPSIVTKLTVALLKLPAVLIDELVENAIEAGREVIAWAKTVADAGIVPYFKELLAKIGPLLKAWFTDLFGVSAQAENDSRSFGDTPGAVKVGMQGLQARFAPGDTVVAAQDPAELMRQAQQATGATSGGEQRVVLDLRDGHLAFDRMFRTNIRAGGSLSSLNSSATGRVKVYG